ncbi:S24 family peptidase [Coralloluteibacterium thermophilus]|uniref:S24 family peptidase n=1 Tax=Coralloluteibacterium thermophilum TaxID=2707049 RepID=A0ABV9NHV1_9GAMM
MGERLAQALDAKGWQPPDLIAASGLSKGTIYNILNDTTKPEKVRESTVRTICGFLGVSAAWLTSGRGPMEASVASPVDEDWADVTGYSQAVGLGLGTEAQEYAETHSLKFRQRSLSRKGLNPRNLHVFYGDGDSMEPRIKKGDALLFDTSDTRPVDGAVYIVKWRGEIYAKRAELTDAGVMFRSDNPAGDHAWGKPKWMNNPKDPIEIIGRVRWIGSWEE